ncbi:Hypothetical protein HVR_LOCUS721 [uncultured virus]|nr:Hypothetical protein HVR_LOCUS721 [uncultured virus]
MSVSQYLMINMLPCILIALFLIYYRNDKEAPVGDYISPLITLMMAVGLLTYPTSPTIFLTGLTLCLDSIGDYFMDKDKLTRPILVFSVAHLVRQLAYFVLSGGVLTIVPIVSWLLTLSLVIILIRYFYYEPEPEDEHQNEFAADISFLFQRIPLIGLYSLIVALTLFNTSVIMGTTNWSHILFIISNLVIGYDLSIRKIQPQIRVLLVPLMYWISEAIFLQTMIQHLN